MGKLKKIGIGFGIIIGLFFVLVIATGVWMASMTPEERQQWEEEQEQRELQRLEEERLKQKQNINSNSPMALYLKAEEGDVNAKKEFDKLAKEYFEPNEEKVENFVLNYRGQDNSGNTLIETIQVMLNVSYPNENILENPSTTVYYLALPDYNRELSDRYWKVEWKIQTYRETVSWVWLVDTDTNTIYAGNKLAKAILDILDAFD